MSKPFITYTAQVEKLKNEKNLIITDDDFAVESLQNISYYALIGAYSARTAHPFQRNGAPFRFKLSKAQQVY